MRPRRSEFWVLFLAILFLGLFAYHSVVRVALVPFAQLPSLIGSALLVPVLLLLSMGFHAWFVLGLAHSAVFLAITVVVSWAFEQVGVATGWVYGAYHYTELLGPKVGHVPVLIPFSWFMMAYPSFIISNLIVDSQETSRWIDKRHWLWVSLVGAGVMTAWDVAIDPLMSGAPHAAWVWHQPGPFFGVPLHNFGGWIATTFVTHVGYRLYERYRQPRPLGTPSAAVVSVPLWAYLTMMIASIAAGGPPGLGCVTVVVMGAPLVLSFHRLLAPAHR